MKKLVPISFAVLAFALLCTGCNKEKNCRCAVKGSQHVRVMTIERGSCEDLNYVEYQDPVHITSLNTDTILCEQM